MNGASNHQNTILIVDDERDSLRLMSAALEAAGITVLIATSGAAAMNLLVHITPDLILMDAVMPAMDGFETTAAIKKNPHLAHIPIIFMTGLTESEHVVEAFEVGGVDYVRKPANIQELLARVRVHMAQGRAQHASVASLDATGRLMLATDAHGPFSGARRWPSARSRGSRPVGARRMWPCRPSSERPFSVCWHGVPWGPAPYGSSSRWERSNWF